MPATSGIASRPTVWVMKGPGWMSRRSIKLAVGPYIEDQTKIETGVRTADTTLEIAVRLTE